MLTLAHPLRPSLASTDAPPTDVFAGCSKRRLVTMRGFSRTLPVMGAAVLAVLSMSCDQSATAPSTSRLKTVATDKPSLDYNSGSSFGGLRSTSFTVTSAGGTFRIGGLYALQFPANSICDPATSTYGPGTWNDPCTTLGRRAVRHDHGDVRVHGLRLHDRLLAGAAIQSQYESSHRDERVRERASRRTRTITRRIRRRCTTSASTTARSSTGRRRPMPASMPAWSRT